LNQRKTELENELQMEREEAKKALEKAQEWRERQIKELTDRKEQEKNAAIQNLTAKTKKEIEELNKSKTEAIKNLETEKNQKIRELEQEKQKLEKSQEQIKNQVLQEKELENKKLSDKVNKKLEKGGFFTPNEQGQNLEEAIDNLLEKQGKLENEIYNLRKQIQQHDNENEIIRTELNAELRKKGQTLRQAATNFLKEKCRDERYKPTTADKCLSVVTAPFK